LNLFDTDKKKPTTNIDDFLGTESSYNSTSVSSSNKPKQVTTGESIPYLKNDEDRKKNIDLVKKEFGALADLLNVKKTNEDETFKIDLFSKKKNTNTNKNISKNLNNINEDDNEYDENYIDIERDMGGVEKVKKMFENMDMESQDDDDNLLDLMDKAAKK
jgi:hypothetical protein